MRRFNSLRYSLTINFVFLAIIPALLVGIFSVWAIQHYMLKEFSEKNIILAKTLVGELEYFLTEPLDLLHQTGSVFASGVITDQGERRRYMDSILENYQFLESVIVLDKDGFVLDMTPYRPEMIGSDMSNQVFFKQSRARGRAYWSPTFISQQTGQPTVAISIRSGNITIVGYLNLVMLNKMVNEIADNARVLSFIADSNGTIIAHPNNRFVKERTNINAVVSRMPENGWKKGKVTFSYHNVDWIGGVDFVSKARWIIVVSRSTKEALSPVFRLLLYFIGFLVVSVVVAVVLSLYSLNRTLNPLVKLSADTKKVITGEAIEVEKLNSFQEIEELADNFSTMVEAIHSRESDLRKSREQYRTLTENLPDFIARYDKNKRHLFVSQNIIEFSVYSADEHIGKDFNDLGATADRVKILNGYIDEVFANAEPVEQEIQLKDKRGEDRWFNWRLVPEYDAGGEVVSVLGMSRDITERKNAQRALQQSEERYRYLMNNLPQCIFYKDIQSIYQVCNDRFAEFMGIRACDIKGKTEFDLFEKAVAEDHLESDRLVLEEGRSLDMERTIRSKDGREIILQVIKTVTRDENGNPAGILGIFWDITAQIRSRDLMIQTEKMMSVGGLATGMAHELNNPLGGILQGIQNIERRLLPDLKVNRQLADELGLNLELLGRYLEARKISRLIQGVRESALRAAEIIKNMLNFGRKSESQMAPNQINQLIDKSINLANNDYDLKKKYDFRQIQLLREYTEPLPDVPCVETEIEQVILNLLRNAAQAFNGAAWQSDPRIIIRTIEESEMVRIEIEDNGPGIPLDTQKHIFEPFYTTKPAGQGTGLGLSVSYMIITNNHHGTLELKSGQEKGTRFIIRLPKVC